MALLGDEEEQGQRKVLREQRVAQPLRRALALLGRLVLRARRVSNGANLGMRFLAADTDALC